MWRVNEFLAHKAATQQNCHLKSLTYLNLLPADSVIFDMVGSRVATAVAQLLGRITVTVVRGSAGTAGDDAPVRIQRAWIPAMHARRASAGTARAPYHASIDAHASLAIVHRVYTGHAHAS
jgi:hypothetical protein